MRHIKIIINFMFSRLFLVAVMLLLQIALISGIIFYFSMSVFSISVLSFDIISFVLMVWMVSREEPPDFKITWIVAILAFPIIGGAFYIMFANKRIPTKLRRRLNNAHQGGHDWFPQNGQSPENRYDTLLSNYIHTLSGYPACGNTSVEYFPIGENMYERMLEELEKAERYILMEYFIIDPGYMWDNIFERLRQKAAEGVEVFLMYDDIGSISTMSKKDNRAIREAGIRLCVFNPFQPHINTMLNYRDHRKITVIDGKTAFCGGINIADEYINRRERFGHWKDTGVMLRGDAVWSFSIMFLLQWRFSTGEDMDIEAYAPADKGFHEDGGLIQVFGDSPLDRYNVTESSYMWAITRAERYIYITTPYLVIDNAMRQALCNAAISGVDVRIITPCHYDKGYVHLLTRSHYSTLISSGVKVYEYTPGFMHGKMFVSDDRICMVGTCNMDFRSFYLHFECSVLMYECPAIFDVKKDMLECMKISHLVDFAEANAISLPKRLLRSLLRLFAPLM